MVNAEPAEIALLKNTSEGLSTVAAGLDWRAGDRIVTAGCEYPSNMYPWMDLTRRKGIELVIIPERQHEDGTVRVSEDDILRAVDHPRTRLVALSHVQFASGQRLDIARIGAATKSAGGLFCVDAIQTVGILPVDVRAMGIDFLAADSHKWLLGPEGAGFFFIRRDLLDQVHPPLLGWNSVQNAQDFDTFDLTLKPTAARYECGTLTIPAFLAMLASAELLAEVGVEFISSRLKGLGDRLTQGLQDRGYRVASPRNDTSFGGEWSGATSFAKAGLDLKAEALRLRREHQIELAVRGGRLRATPHFYNTEAEIDLLLNALT
jgi:cysteine desulfurase/selenocysteine lyase